MEIKISKEVRNFTESILLGLSIRQCIFSLTACIIAIIIYFLTIDKLGSELTSWLCIIGAIPFAILGFINYQSMNAEVILITALRSFLLSKANLIDKPSNLYYEICKPIIKKYKKEVLKKNDKKLSKNKTTK